MKYPQRRILTLAASVAGALALAAGMSRAQKNQAGEIRIYKGEPAMTAGMGLLPWGSGEAKETEEHVFIGSKGVKITTHGRYQGARIVMPAPADLKGSLDDKSAYLQFTLMLPPKDSTSHMGSDYGMMGGMGKMGGIGGRGGAGGRGGRGGGGEGGLGGGLGGLGGAPGGGSGGQSSQLVKPKPLSAIRLVLVTSDGKHVETNLDLNASTKLQDDWNSVAVPLVALPGLKDTNGELKEVQLFGNSPAIFYLGEARVIRDETPIHVDDLPEQTVAVGDIVTFIGSAEGGAAPLKYEWDFDNTDGVDIDAQGRVVKHKFRKSRKDPAGNTIPDVVTLTVRDIYGLKKPVTTSTKINVTL